MMESYTEGYGSALHLPASDVDMLVAPPGTSLGQMDAATLFSEVVQALGLTELGVYTPWASRDGDTEWTEIKNPDTNIMLWGLTDAQIAQATAVTFGSPLPFVAVVTKDPLTTTAIAQMWQGTAYKPYETQAVYNQRDAKPVPDMLFVHWGERIDVAALPKQVLAISPRAVQIGGQLVFGAQVPVQSTTLRDPPASSFSDAITAKLASAPGPSPTPVPARPATPSATATARTKVSLAIPIAVGLGAVALGFYIGHRR